MHWPVLLRIFETRLPKCICAISSMLKCNKTSLYRVHRSAVSSYRHHYYDTYNKVAVYIKVNKLNASQNGTLSSCGCFEI